MRILIACNSYEHTRDLSLALASQPHAYEFDLVHNWEQVRAQIYTQHYGLVIMDCRLDGKPAWQVGRDYCRVISDPQDIMLPPDRKPVMVALDNFKFDRLQKALCEECGFDFYAVKPISSEDLYSWAALAMCELD